MLRDSLYVLASLVLYYSLLSWKTVQPMPTVTLQLKLQ